MKVIASIDQGTSSTRVLLFNTTGELVFTHQVELKQILPQPGWVEEDPMAMMKTTQECLEAAAHFVQLRGATVVAMGVANQRETTIAWDPVTGQPLHNAIVWLDTRTKETVDEIVSSTPKEKLEAIRAKCGLPVATYFSALKMRWLLKNVPEITEAAKQGRCLFGTVDSWIIWNLTGGVKGGVHMTDVSNASRTMLMGLDSLQWDDELCEFFQVPKSLLPAIRSSSEVYGAVTAALPLKGTPISSCIGDQQAALVGQQCFIPGSAKNTYGTGCFMLLNTGTKSVKSEHGLITTVAYQLGPKSPASFALEGSIAIAGAAVQWFRDNMNAIKEASEIQQLAEEVPDTGGVYFVPAFSGLFAPYWRTDARGAILGITQFTTKAHIARALLEATCFQTLEVLNAMEKDSGQALCDLRVDGGMTKSDLLVQLQADILGVPVVRPVLRETTSLGAAILAGMAVGLWKIENGCIPSISRAAGTFHPTTTPEQRATRLAQWQKAIERSLGWV